MVRVRVAGICNTDLEITRGYRGFHGILGHEFVGEVVQSPDSAWLGKRVCGEITIPCTSCQSCNLGRPNHCLRRAVVGIWDRDGVFADYVALPIRNLHAVPDQITDDDAVFVEPLAAAFEIAEQIVFTADQRVAVLGDGKLGLLCAQAIATTGAKIVVIGKHDHKLALARDLGIDAAFSRDIAEETFDVVVEATGSETGFTRAVTLVRARGTVVVKSTLASPLVMDLAPVVVNEITVLGSRCGPFSRAIQALESRTVRVSPLIAARYPLDHAEEAMRHAANGALKVLIEI